MLILSKFNLSKIATITIPTKKEKIPKNPKNIYIIFTLYCIYLAIPI